MQLELRSYPRAEIAEVLSVNPKDSKHFAERVRDRLTKWGYGFRYSTPEVIITSKPETAEERLTEILAREYGLDVQINPVQFACFVTAFTEIEGFDRMPWGKRASAFYERFGFSVDERTLRNWCSRLIQWGIIARGVNATTWKTEIIKGKKRRVIVEESDKEEMRAYFQRRSEILQEEARSGLPKGEVWSNTYKRLWAEFSCCYYYCKCFDLSAFSESSDLCEIYELVHELAGMAPDLPKASLKPPSSKDEFDREWFTQ